MRMLQAHCSIKPKAKSAGIYTHYSQYLQLTRVQLILNCSNGNSSLTRNVAKCKSKSSDFMTLNVLVCDSNLLMSHQQVRGDRHEKHNVENLLMTIIADKGGISVASGCCLCFIIAALLWQAKKSVKAE